MTSTNTLSGGSSWTPAAIHTYEYTSLTGANATICNISPTSFPQQAKLTVNALSCKPEFDIGRFHPAPNSTVEIYLPATLAGLQTVLDAAIDDWNTYLATQSVQLSRVSSSCGTGPNCINFEITTLPANKCGWARYDPGDTATGLHTGGLKIQLDTTWSSYTAQGMQRTLAHEIAHLLGLTDYDDYCLLESDAIMNEDFFCRDPQQLPATAVTKNDHGPVINTVYNGKSGRSCGF